MSFLQFSKPKSPMHYFLNMFSRRKLCRGGLTTTVWFVLVVTLIFFVLNRQNIFMTKNTNNIKSVVDSPSLSDISHFKSHLIKMRTFLSKISNSTSNGRNGKVETDAEDDYVEEKMLLENFGEMFVDIAKYVETSGRERDNEMDSGNPAEEHPEKKPADMVDEVERQKQNIREWDQVYENFEDRPLHGDKAEDSEKILQTFVQNWDPFYIEFPSEQAQDRILIHFQLPSHVAEGLNKEMQKIESNRQKFSLPDPVQLNIYPDSTRSWKAWHSHITQYGIYDPDDPAFKRVLTEMKTSPIEDAYQPSGGTQQKLVFYLDTGLRLIFKPMRFPRKQEALPDHMFWRDYERHIAEIAAFNLDRVLGYHRVPPVVGRYINVTHDVKRFADEELKRTIFRSPAGNICFYGTCQYYCDTAHAVCGRPEILEGSVMAYLPTSTRTQRASWRHPWRRSYSKHHQRAAWQDDYDYCDSVRNEAPYNKGRRMLDLMEMAVFDFLTGNMDRHHYETFKVFDKEGNYSSPVLFDNGRGFGKSKHDELTILAPVYQCCLMRYSTLNKLLKFHYGPQHLSDVMRESLSHDPASPILLESHLNALDRRLDMVLLTLHACVQKKGFHNVVRDDGL